MAVKCEDCWQPCCDYRTVEYKFARNEVKMMREAGAKVRLAWWRLWNGLWYVLDNPCPFFAAGKCLLHGLPTQPKCCENNKAGGDFCLEKRSELDRMNK